MSDQPFDTWESTDSKRLLAVKPSEEILDSSELNLGFALKKFEELKKKYEELENESQQVKMMNIKKWEFEKEEPVSSSSEFIKEALNKRVNSIESLQKYDLEFDEYSGLILLTYYFESRLTLEEERKIAELEVLILERINVFRIKFHRIYKR